MPLFCKYTSKYQCLCCNLAKTDSTYNNKYKRIKTESQLVQKLLNMCLHNIYMRSSGIFIVITFALSSKMINWLRYTSRIANSNRTNLCMWWYINSNCRRILNKRKLEKIGKNSFSVSNLGR